MKTAADLEANFRKKQLGLATYRLALENAAKEDRPTAKARYDEAWDELLNLRLSLERQQQHERNEQCKLS